MRKPRQSLPHIGSLVRKCHELEELEAAGYNPSRGDDYDYPADIQAAEQRLPPNVKRKEVH